MSLLAIPFLCVRSNNLFTSNIDAKQCFENQDKQKISETMVENKIVEGSLIIPKGIATISHRKGSRLISIFLSFKPMSITMSKCQCNNVTMFFFK